MRGLAAVRVAYGAVLVVASGRIVERVTGERSSRAAAVGRVLGVRHVLQGLALGRTRSESWWTAGAAIDVLHALSMVGLVGYSDDHRRLAALDALAAGAWTASGWLACRRS